MKFIDRLKQNKIIIFDGAMGTQLQQAGIRDDKWQGKEGCNEYLNLTAPEVIKNIHLDYLRAGADVIETNSFGGSPITLAEYSLSEKSFEINKAAAEIASDAAAQMIKFRKCFVAGSIGPGTKLPSLGQISYDELYDAYCIQAAGLIAGGVDLFIVETCQDLLQVKAAVNAIRDQEKITGNILPIIISVTVEANGTMLLGSDINCAITVCSSLQADVMSINCATGPDAMASYIKEMVKYFNGPVMVMPNAGLPRNIAGKMVYNLSAEEFSDRLIKYIKVDGVQIVGGCCGTTPQYIDLLKSKSASIEPVKRIIEIAPAIASLYISQNLKQNPGPFMIGERTNANGSKKFREHLLAGDWDSILEIARLQEKNGAHALDLCVAYTGRDEVADITEAVKKIASQINIPLVFDSTNIKALEAALKLYAGKAVINSINLEDGEERARAICKLARRYGAALIALTIDEDGMAKDALQKLAIAKRLYKIAVDENGILPSDLIFDPLTFTLGSGDASLTSAGVETLTAIKSIKQEFPEVFTLLGLSNISFGLSFDSRKVLNAVYLNEALQAGLDLAIINVQHIVPLYKIAADDNDMALELIYSSEDSSKLLKFINHFKQKFTGTQNIDPEISAQLSLDDKIKQKVINGSKAGLDILLKEKLQEIPALEIVNQLLIPAMKRVGELFGNGQMQLPFVLMSAEVMKVAVDILEPFMEKSDFTEKTSIVLATVKGDVHDIGKNLVDIILTNNGFKVYNLGIKCEIETILNKAKEVNASAIGLSGLLVKSTIVMKEDLEFLQTEGFDIPVLLGGAALTGKYVYESCDPILESPVIYCKDAFSGLKIMNAIKGQDLIEIYKIEKQRHQKNIPNLQIIEGQEGAEEQEKIDYSIDVPAPPFLGNRIIKDNFELEDIFSYITEEVLFRGRWGYRRGKLSKKEYEKLIKKEVRPDYEKLKNFIKKENLFVPQVVYGYFLCNSRDQDVIIYHPHSGDEWKTLHFPRQKQAPYKCVADYFIPEKLARKDLIALQVVTIGNKAGEYAQELYENNQYKDYLLFHGLGVETAEALAEYWHKKIREELKIASSDSEKMDELVVQQYRGSRYSFGYPACPDMQGNQIIFELLKPEEIGVTLTENMQMVPEQTTSAFIAHHPQAKYFNVS